VGDSLEEDVCGANAVGMNGLLLDREGRAHDGIVTALGQINPLCRSISRPRSTKD